MSNSGLKDSLIYPLIVAIVGAVVGGAITYFVQDNHEDSMVKAMSYHFESVDENMELEHALDQIHKENEKTKEENKKLKDENENLKIEINNVLNRESTNNAESGKQDKDTKIDLIDSGALYDGYDFEIITTSSDNTLCMGSDEFNKGFRINSYFSSGYVLLDLKGKYSKISFDVARITGSDINDATLRALIGDNDKKEYALIGEKPIERITIDLNYANSLKLQIAGNGRTYYGFANCTLEK